MRIGPDRRQHVRYALPSMYTTIAVRLPDELAFGRTGHAYDVSVGGMRFELDEPIESGTRVGVRIELPGGASLPVTRRRAVFAMANIVWVQEDDLEVPGPVRMACTFTNFCSPGDEERLLGRLESGRFSRAA